MTVRDILQDELDHITEPTRSIIITDDEKCPPYAGEEFINIYGCRCVNEYSPSFSSRKEVYGLKIGITRRFSGIPQDLSGQSIYTYDDDLMQRTKESMAARATQIVNLLDGNWGVPALIRQEDYCDVVTPLGFVGNSELEEVYAEHFRGEDDGDRPQALFLELEFDGLESYYDKY